MSDKPRTENTFDHEGRLVRSETAREIALKEQDQIKKDILDTRTRLDEFSLRDFSEGLFGEEYTEIVYGKEGGKIRMGDLKMSMTGAGPGDASIKLDRDQLITIMKDAHPSLTHDEVIGLLTSQPENVKQMAIQHLTEHEAFVDADHQAAFENLDEIQGNAVKSRIIKP